MFSYRFKHVLLTSFGNTFCKRHGIWFLLNNFLSTLIEGTSLFVGCRSEGSARSSSRSRNRLQRSAVAIGDPREKRREALSRAPSGRYCPVISNVERDCVSAIARSRRRGIWDRDASSIGVESTAGDCGAIVHIALSSMIDPSLLCVTAHFTRGSMIHSLRHASLFEEKFTGVPADYRRIMNASCLSAARF